MIYKNCPVILACSFEYQGMKVKSPGEEQALKKIKSDDALKELIPKLNGKMGEQMSMHALCLILAYMLRMNELNEDTQENLDYILSKVPYQMEQLIQMAMVLGIEFKQGRSKKRITAKNLLTLISFSQNMFQGMWIDDDPFLQLPHMDYDRIKKLRRNHKALTVEQYCNMTSTERKALSIFDNDEQFNDAEMAVSVFPAIDVNVSFFVEGEQEIAVGDILTIKIQIVHKNLKEGENLGFVHSNKFPYLKQSSWFMVFTDMEENDFFAMEKLFIKEPVFTKEIKERMQRPGVMQFCIILRNDSYRGFDKKVQLQINVLREAKRATLEYDPEDLQAQKAPSLMQQMMDVNGNDSDDDEEEEETASTEATNGNAEKSNEAKKDQWFVDS